MISPLTAHCSAVAAGHLGKHQPSRWAFDSLGADESDPRTVGLCFLDPGLQPGGLHRPETVVECSVSHALLDTAGNHPGHVFGLPGQEFLAITLAPVLVGGACVDRPGAPFFFPL